MKAVRSLSKVLASKQTLQHERASLTSLPDEAHTLEQAARSSAQGWGLHTHAREGAAGVAVFDEHLRYVQINESLARINGLSVEEHLGKTLHEVVPHIAPVLEPLLERIFETGEPALNVEIKSQRGNSKGTARQWLLSLIPLPADGNQGRPRGVGVLAIELTGLKLAEPAPYQNVRELQTRRKLDAPPQPTVSLERQIRALRDVSTVLSTAAQILEQTHASRSYGGLDISSGIDFYEEVQRFEDDLIRRALKLTGGNQKQAAQLLGIKPTTLHTILKRHKIEVD